MHIALKLPCGHVLHGADAPEAMGFKLVLGTNITLNIRPESKIESDKIFNALSDGGKITHPLEDTFWGAYYGQLTDKFGIQWMINYEKR